MHNDNATTKTLLSEVTEQAYRQQILKQTGASGFSDRNFSNYLQHVHTRGDLATATFIIRRGRRTRVSLSSSESRGASGERTRSRRSARPSATAVVCLRTDIFSFGSYWHEGRPSCVHTYVASRGRNSDFPGKQRPHGGRASATTVRLRAIFRLYCPLHLIWRPESINGASDFTLLECRRVGAPSSIARSLARSLVILAPILHEFLANRL